MTKTLLHTGRVVLALLLSLALAMAFCSAGVSAVWAAGDDDARTQANGTSANEDTDEDEGKNEDGADAPAKADRATKIYLELYGVAGSSKTWDTGQLLSDGKRNVSATISRAGGEARICVNAARENSADISQADADPQTGWDAWGELKDFSYEITGGDADCLRVSSSGLVTAVSDGEATVTVTAKGSDYSSLKPASMKIKVTNQASSLQVKSIEIVDKDGKAYGNDNLKVTSTDIVKLYARVTYKDLSDDSKTVVYSNYPSAPKSETPEDGAFDTLQWELSTDEDYASLSQHEDSGAPAVGYFRAKANSTVQVTARINGADPKKSFGMGKGVAVNQVGITINLGTKEGKVDGEDPADKLTVKVVYEKDQDTVVLEKTYSIAEFEALGAVTRTYTLTRSGGKFVTDKAYGVPIATLLQALDIASSDVNYFTLAANDGANPGKITAKWLLRTTRYYLPNYDIGGSWQGKEQVPSMIALSDSWCANTLLTGNLNSGTRFRLMFGSSTSSDNATSKSVKFINTLTIVMDGAPPSRHGKDASSEKGDQTTQTTPGENGTNATPGGDEPGGGSGNDEGSATSGSGGARGKNTIGAVKGAANNGATAGNSDVGGVKELDQGTQWRIHQMMNKSNSDLVPLGYEDNPFAPFVLPAVILVFLLAAGCRLGVFRYRLKKS